MNSSSSSDEGEKLDTSASSIPSRSQDRIDYENPIRANKHGRTS